MDMTTLPTPLPPALPAAAPEPAEPPPEVDSTLALVLFSGTDDKLAAAAVLAAGAAAMGRPVHIFLQYWALEAFRKDRITQDHGYAPEATDSGVAAVQGHGAEHWSETLRQVKEIGEVAVQACALSMEIFHLQQEDLDPIVDGVEGVAAFMAAVNGPVVFI